MNISQSAFVALILMLPGVVSLQVYRRIQGKRYASKWDYFIDVVVFSCIIYTPPVLIGHLYDYSWSIGNFLLFALGKSTEFDPSSVFRDVLIGAGFAVPVAMVRAHLERGQRLTRFLQALDISNRTGDEDIWHHFHHYVTRDHEWFMVRDDETGISYEGQVVAYSESGQLRELVLFEVSVYSSEEAKHLYDCETLYLSFPSERAIVIEAVRRGATNE